MATMPEPRPLLSGPPPQGSTLGVEARQLQSFLDAL